MPAGLSKIEKYCSGIVVIYHLIVLAVAIYFGYTLLLEVTRGLGTPSMNSYLPAAVLLKLSLTFGALGGALSANRFVVRAIRYKKYDLHRVAWQLTTPIHGAVLAFVGVIVINGGLMTLSNGNGNEYNYPYFVAGFSFLTGFASELFVKRLSAAAEALFGEKSAIDRGDDKDV
jgi:hypothetical protein